MSTLTGACIVALGDKTAGLFTKDQQLKAHLTTLGEEWHEPLWQLPVRDEDFEGMKGTFSDLINVGSSKFAGSSGAAAFLMNFVDDKIGYAHLDIAGPAESKQDKFVNTKGCTGFGT